jgi:multiple sugar transport system ATP-binding protein
LNYNGETLLSTELSSMPAGTKEGDFSILASGFFLFDHDGKLIYGGESHDE